MQKTMHEMEDVAHSTYLYFWIYKITAPSVSSFLKNKFKQKQKEVP